MMNEISFWDKYDENIKFKGLYVHKVDENAVDIYMQANAREAIEKGATSITVDSDYERKDYSIYIFDDKVEIVLISTEKWDDEDYDDYESNMYCDSYGVCGGHTCPQYRECYGMMRGII